MASQSPYPIIVYSVANYTSNFSQFWLNVLLLRSQLSRFLFLRIDPFFRLNKEHFTEELSYTLN